MRSLNPGMGTLGERLREDLRLPYYATGDILRAAEAIAPTRPHPGVESPAAHLLLGPPMAVFDRVRDLLRSTLRR